MNRSIILALAGSFLFLTGCDNSKKAEEAAAAAAASATAAADAAKAEAEKAAEAAKKAAEDAFAEKRATAVKGLQGQADAFDRKLTYLKEKAEKLKGPAKAKADEALKAVETARAQVTASLKDAETATDTSLPTVTEKVSSGLAAAQKALADFETSVTGKK